MSWWNTLRNAIMGAPRRKARKLSATEVEQLLNGGSVAPDRRALAALLASAAAPGAAEDQTGLEATVDAFMRARQQEWLRAGSPGAPAGGTRRQSTARRGSFGRGAKPGPLKLTIGAAAMAIVTAGVVVATGQLPAPAQHRVHGLLAAVGLSVPDGSRASAESPASSSKSAPAQSRATRSTTPAPGSLSTAMASPVLVPLCQTYLAGRKPGKGMTAGDLDRLAQAAGTTDNIEAFCTELVTRQSPTPTATTSPGTNSSTGTDSKQGCHGNGKKTCPNLSDGSASRRLPG